MADHQQQQPQQSPPQQQQQPQQPQPQQQALLQQGTEYTLQGVMRYLQVEWHNHERARNAWEIERAELKAKIARTEGDFRNARRLNATLDKHVRFLEISLRKEREKSRLLAQTKGDPPPSYDEGSRQSKHEPNGIRLSSRDEGPSSASADYNRLIGNTKSEDEPQQHESQSLSHSEREAHREKTKQFLQKTVEELTYILHPPAHAPPPLPPPESLEMNNTDMHQPEMTAEELYTQQVQMKRNQMANVSHLPTIPNSTSNHHPPPVRQPPEYVNSMANHHAPPVQTQALARDQPQNLPPAPPSQRSSIDEVNEVRLPRDRYDQHAELTSQSFDPYARQITTRAEEIDPTQPVVQEDADGWNFDDDDNEIDAIEPRRSDVDLFPAAAIGIPPKSPTRGGLHTRRRSSGSQRASRRPSDGSHEVRDLSSPHGDFTDFKIQFALRGHLDVIRAVIFTGGGSPSEPEICTASDDGTLKRWIIPARYSSYGNGHTSSQQHHSSLSQQYAVSPDLDLQSYFTHRGHEGIVTTLAACPASPSFSTGGRATGDGWVFSGGSDATIRVWERGRVDPKATMEGHTDAIWALSVLPAPASHIMGSDSSYLQQGSGAGASEGRILLVSGSADSTIRIWSVSAPPQLASPQTVPGGGSRRGVGGSRRHSITSGSNFPSSPQPSTASNTPFSYALIHTISLPSLGSPTCICPMGAAGESFVVSWTNSSILVFDSRTGEQIIGMASDATYDGTSATSINSVVVTNTSVENVGGGANDAIEGATGSGKDGGVQGVIISGHEDCFVNFYDANSGQCTYSMLSHPDSVAALALSPDGRELVTGGHDCSLRFWSLERRSCTQEVTAHRAMRGEGIAAVVWSSDGRWVVSGGGDGVVKIFGR